MSAAARVADESRGRVLAIGVPLLLYCASRRSCTGRRAPAPELSIDHIAYFKLTDELRAAASRRRLLARLRRAARLLGAGRVPVRLHRLPHREPEAADGGHDGRLPRHVRAAALLPDAGSRPLSVLFSLLSALFVSFGAAFWGFTDFAASLHRTLILPIFVLVIWFFLRFRASPWRYATYPFLVLISLIHLSLLLPAAGAARLRGTRLRLPAAASSSTAACSTSRWGSPRSSRRARR